MAFAIALAVGESACSQKVTIPIFRVIRGDVIFNGWQRLRPAPSSAIPGMMPTPAFAMVTKVWWCSISCADTRVSPCSAKSARFGDGDEGFKFLDGDTEHGLERFQSIDPFLRTIIHIFLLD